MEIERPKAIGVDRAVVALDWPRPQVRRVLSQLASKGWLQRTRRGSYEPLFAETGGIAVPSAWAALTEWRVPHYVAFASAAYELGLTPDRPGEVQVCVRVGTSRPKAWQSVRLRLIPLRTFSIDGTDERDLHGYPIRVSNVEKTLVDSAAVPARAGGPFGLARMVTRAIGAADWSEFARLAASTANGGPAARRLAALLDVLEEQIPSELQQVAEASARDTSPFFLGSGEVHGRRGGELRPWGVVVNVSPEGLREEVQR